MAIFSFVAVSLLGSVAPVFGTYGYGYGYSNVHVVQPVVPALYKSPLIGYQYSHITPPSTYPFATQPIYGGLLGAPCLSSPFTTTSTFNWPKTYVAPKVDIKTKNGTKHIFKEVYPPGFLTPIFSYQGSIQNIHPKGPGGADAAGGAAGGPAPEGAKGGPANGPAPAGGEGEGGEAQPKGETEKESEAEGKAAGGSEGEEKKEAKAKAAKILKKKNKRSGLKKAAKLSRMPDLSI